MTTITANIAVPDTLGTSNSKRKEKTMFKDTLKRNMAQVVEAALAEASGMSLPPLDPEAVDDEDFAVLARLYALGNEYQATDYDYDDGIFAFAFEREEDANAFADQVERDEAVDEVEVLEDEEGFIVFASLVDEEVAFIETDTPISECFQLDEVQRKVKVNALGKRRIKMQCAKGFKWNGKACIKISGSELASSRMAHRRAVLNKRAQGNALKLRTLRKTKKANRFRKAMGL